VPMIIIGYYLAGSSLKSIFGNPGIYVAASIKMIISPIIALVICYVLGFDRTMAVSCLIATSASSAAMTTMLATKFGRDAELSAGMVSFTTIAAIVTMPVFIAIAGMLG
ncbi:MAG: AEC family transporter, partial [Lachnospiraceae bacterium]|nr:AEC family transporter [Lachnospiraceae bacterium]